MPRTSPGKSVTLRSPNTASAYAACAAASPEDEPLISDAFIDAFKLGSMPVAGRKNNPPLEEIQRVFDAVHHQALTELPMVDDAELDNPTDPPHPAFKTKLGAIDFSSQHELVHAGQIAMLRRLMGKPPLR